MYTNDENGYRRHQFVSEEMGKAELKKETPIREIRKTTVGGEERGSGCRMEGKGERRLGVLASDIATDNRKFPLKECKGDGLKNSRVSCKTGPSAPIQVQMQWALGLYRTRNLYNILKKNQQYALIVPSFIYFYVLAPTCFGTSLPSSGSLLDPLELLENTN
jgi:hypothetical protein